VPQRTAAPLGSRVVQEVFNATVAAGPRPRWRSLSLNLSHHRTVNTKWSGLLFGLGLVAIANIGAFWFGKLFKGVVAVLVASAVVVSWLWIRHRKTQLVRDLRNADRATQDTVLAELDADDRREILRKLGRDDG